MPTSSGPASPPWPRSWPGSTPRARGGESRRHDRPARIEGDHSMWKLLLILAAVAHLAGCESQGFRTRRHGILIQRWPKGWGGRGSLDDLKARAAGVNEARSAREATRFPEAAHR